ELGENSNMSLLKVAGRTHRIARHRGLNRRARRPAIERIEDRVMLSADIILEWNRVLLAAVRVDRTPPPVAARDMAMVQAAVYDGVNAIDRTYEPYRVDVKAPRGTSPEAAAAAAAHRVLVSLFPAQSAAFDAELVSSLAEIRDGPAEHKGVRLGEEVADSI